MKNELFMYTNARSLLAHKDEIFHQVMESVNPAFVALSETRITRNIEDYEVNVPGYSLIRCDAENRNTGELLYMYIVILSIM